MSVTLIDDGQLVMDLTAEEQTELALCEAIIERGRQVFLEVGGALATIQEKRLYRATHASFETYLREKWEISRTYAYEMIAAYGIVENVRHAGQSEVLPENPRQALALRNVPDAEQAGVLQKAVDTAPEGKLTAAHIQHVADQHTGKDVEKAEAAGIPVTDNRSVQKPPDAPKPTQETPAPSAGGDFLQCLIPREEDDWLWENDLTAATAIAELRSARAQLAAFQVTLQRPQLTDRAYLALQALTDHHNAKHPGEPILPAIMLESSLVVRCGILGITIPENEETANEQ